jgi:hypothetical protein
MYNWFEFGITALTAQDNKVFAKWEQTRKHLTETGGYSATELPIIEIASTLHGLENGKIVEYWIYLDKAGFNNLLQQGKNN